MRTDDGYIIRQCLDGKASAFGLLVDKYKRGIYALAYSEVRNFHDAQDITQEVFIKVYRNLHTLKRWDSFMGWLYRITMNVCKNWVRTESRRPDTDYIEDQDISIIDDPSIESYRRDGIYESVRDSLDLLPEVHRQVLTLRYFGGMSIKEMCRFLGVSHGTIERRLSEAQARLKGEILAMIDTDSRQYELPSSFTFRIVEMIKGIRIHPISPTKALPWGFSIAIGILAGFLSIGTHLNFNETIGTFINPSSEPKVLDVGEYPVDVMDIAKIPDMSNGLGSVVPNLQNAFFMAPQVGDTWTKKADMPTARFALSTSVVNGKIYAIGGQIRGGARVSTVEEYNPITDTWTEKADMPTPRGYLSTSVANGKIYAIGGINNESNPISTVEEYDPVTDKWTKKADMPTRRAHFSATAVNGKIYAIGGFAAGQGAEFSIVEEYDPVKDEWTRKTDMPTNRAFHSACAVDGKIYVIGAWRLGSVISTVEEYDPVTDKWTKKADMPTPRTRFCADVINGKIYTIGGSGSLMVGLEFFSTVEEYDPATDRWAKKADMPTVRDWLSASVVNGKIYIIGGEFVANPNAIRDIFSTVEEYDPGTSGQGINFKGKLPTTWGDVKLAQSR